MNLIPAIKLLKKAKEIHDYVKKPNNLDLQADMFLVRLEKLEKKVDKLLKKSKSKKVASEPKWYEDK